MKILLVLPAGKNYRVKPGKQRIPKRNMLRFSVLPLTTVAALTPSQHRVTLCDENVQPLDFNADVDVVGVTFMTGMANRAYEIAREFRRRGKITVAGGYHPTFCPEEAAGQFDIVVVGEAERIWAQVLEDIQVGHFQKIYRNKTLVDLAETPIPRRDLTEKTAKHYVTTNAVQVGRGCHNSCRFCSIAAFYKNTYRTRPLENVLHELEQLPKNIMFIDDNIAADPEYAGKLFRAMIPMKKRWVSQASIRIADDPELLKLAYQAGCRGLFIGFETISEKNLYAMDKGFNDPSGYQKRIRTIHKAGIGVQAAIMMGLDHDDVTVFQRTLRFLQKAHVDALQLSIMTPLPGTPLFDDFKKTNRIIDWNWSHYDYRHTVIRPRRMTPKQLQDGADWLYNQFYRLDRILLRALRSAFCPGLLLAFITLKLGMTYRYDNRHEGIVGKNPARTFLPSFLFKRLQKEGL